MPVTKGRGSLNKPRSVSMDDDLWGAVTMEARAAGVTVSEWVRLAVAARVAKTLGRVETLPTRGPRP